MTVSREKPSSASGPRLVSAPRRRAWNDNVLAELYGALMFCSHFVLSDSDEKSRLFTELFGDTTTHTAITAPHLLMRTEIR